MVESEYSPGNCKYLNISISAMKKIPEMPRFVPDDAKSKKMCKMLLKSCLL